MKIAVPVQGLGLHIKAQGPYNLRLVKGMNPPRDVHSFSLILQHHGLVIEVENL